MRIAVISDLHANLQAWRAALRDLVGAGADSIVCLGDVIGYGPEPQAVLDGLREATDNIVMGNHEAAIAGRMDLSDFGDPARRLIEWTRDRLDEEAVRFLKTLPPGISGHGALFVHAEAVDPMRFQYIEDAASARANLEDRAERLVFAGHTHLPGVFVMDSGGEVVHGVPPLVRLRPAMRYLVNVGSVGEPRDLDPRGAYALFDDERGTVEFRRFEFDIAGYRFALTRTGLDYEPFFLAAHRRREFLAGAGAAETGASAAAASSAPRALAGSRILRPMEEVPPPVPAPLQTGTKVLTLPTDMAEASHRAIEDARRLHSRRVLIRAATVLLLLGLSGLAAWEHHRRTAPVAQPETVAPADFAVVTEKEFSHGSVPGFRSQQALLHNETDLSDRAQPAGTGMEPGGMGTTAAVGTEIQGLPATPPPSSAAPSAAPSLSPAPSKLGDTEHEAGMQSLSPPRSDGNQEAAGGREVSPASEPSRAVGDMQSSAEEGKADFTSREITRAAVPGPIMPTLSRPPSYKLARSSASRTPPGANRPAGGLQAMGGDRSQSGLSLLPPPAAGATMRGAVWLVCFGRGDPFLAPGGVIWNDMADGFVPPAPAKRVWKDAGGRREIEATVVSVEGPLVATRGGVSGRRLVMFGHMVPDDATDGAWAADGGPASLVFRLSGLRPEARYAVHVLAGGNTTKGGPVEEWSVEGASGPAGRYWSTGTDGAELTSPLVPTAEGTLTLAFRFAAGYGSSGINTLGICEVPATKEDGR